ncbi:MAG TPA: lysine--tRNA ligase [Chloroflexota bacterium]|nr:lysine--tRNA ligase [Chloroflexota bacterium]
MTERDELRESREQKLEQLLALGLPALPNRFGPTRHSAEIKDQYEALEGSVVRVAGRVMARRLMGKAAFAHILDAGGQIQLYFKLDVLGPEQFEYFKLLDLGDLIGAEGTVFKTRTGEVSIQVQNLVLLAKALLPLPEKFHGLSDIETRYRQRYLDLIANDETREIFRIRTAAVRGIRRYLDCLGFVEVETPILQPVYGGAAATPFTTHYNAFDTTVYLRIADELYLKRLIVGGMERVYEISKDFRNEGVSWKHSNEFTMLEFYQAYADYNDIMAEVEDMLSTVAQSVLGTTRVSFRGHEVDLSPPWQRVSIADALRRWADLDIESIEDLGALQEEAARRGVQVAPDTKRGVVIEELVGALVEPHLIEPTFLIDFPVDFPGSLLAKRKAGRPDIAERFEPYIAGMELGNGFTELNEPKDQLRRMQELNHEAGENHAEVDWDYIRALEHGMPPTGGVGIGIDRFAMVLAGVDSIRETVLFPPMRPRETPRAES